MTNNTCIKCHKTSQWFLSEFCFSCMKDEDERKLTEGILSGEVEGTDCEDDIVCPWCGTRYEPFDIDEDCSFMDESEYEKKCYMCDHSFVYQATVSITFETRRVE